MLDFLLMTITGTASKKNQDDLGLMIVAIVVVVVVVIMLLIFIATRDKDSEEDKGTSNNLETKNDSSLQVLTTNDVKEEIVVEKTNLTEEDVGNLEKYKKLFDDGIITQEEYDAFKQQTLNIVKKEASRIKCPNCGGHNCSIINEVTTDGKDYEASKGCCGAILLGPIGLLCGACGDGKEVKNTNYWVCNNCGHKWKV